MVNYNKRLAEVDEILKYLPEKELLKIPDYIRQEIKDKKDKEYIWKYDDSKELKDNNLNRDTIIIMSYLNMKYLLNDEQKKFMQQVYKLNEKKLEEAKSKKYSTEELFKKNKLQKEDLKEIELVKNQALVEYKESFFKKIINKMKSFFRI